MPAIRPPSQAEIGAWLEEERLLLDPVDHKMRKQAAASEAAGQGSGFAMDANTGKLIPVGADASQVTQALHPLFTPPPPPPPPGLHGTFTG